jgi:hypothetical protein
LHQKISVFSGTRSWKVDEREGGGSGSLNNEAQRKERERNPADKEARSLPRKKLGKKTHESSGILDGEERREGIKWEERIKSSGVVVVL